MNKNMKISFQKEREKRKEGFIKLSLFLSLFLCPISLCVCKHVCVSTSLSLYECVFVNGFCVCEQFQIFKLSDDAGLFSGKRVFSLSLSPNVLSPLKSP